MGDIFLKISQPLVAKNVIDETIMPRVHESIGAVAEIARQRWQNEIMKAKGVWYVEKQEYAKSINWNYTGPLKARVSTTYKKADQIENGTPSRDLKQMLQTSQKVRISHTKKHAGQKYLIIPFRHNTPGNEAHANAMPPDIYQIASQLQPSRVIGKTTRLSGQSPHYKRLTAHSPRRLAPPNPSMHVPQNIYQWGGRLPAGLAPKLKQHHHSDPYANMVKMDTSSGKQKSSAYMTFRVMGAWSSGWIVPARPGLHLAQKVTNELKPTAEKVLWQAAIKDAMDD